MRATIAVLPGDGIGPEVTAQAVRVLRAVAQLGDSELDLVEAPIGGRAIEETGGSLPEATLQLCLRADAMLLGAVGGPAWDDPRRGVRPEQGLLALRQALGVFANLRPVKVLPSLRAASPLRAKILDGVDILFVRELTGGIYFGRKREEPERAEDTCAYSAEEVRRVVQVAARLARGRRGKLTSVDKANILATSRLWRRVTAEVVRDEFPDLEHLLVDACAMHLLRRPRDFDVIVTENLFGDILTDEAAMLVGSLGLLPSASLGEGPRGLYEPVHGSAPDLAGRNVANPLGAILSAALLLRYSLGLEAAARAVEEAVQRTLTRGFLSADLTPPGRAASTSEVGNAVLAALTERAPDKRV